jgi:hypothetical protein
MNPTLALIYQYPPEWPKPLVDHLYDNIAPTVKTWGRDTLTLLKRYLRQSPSEQTAIQINGFHTNMSHQRKPIDVLLVMMVRRKKGRPINFICLVGSNEQVMRKSNRIVAEVQAEALSKKFTATIRESICT